MVNLKYHTLRFILAVVIASIALSCVNTLFVVETEGSVAEVLATNAGLSTHFAVSEDGNIYVLRTEEKIQVFNSATGEKISEFVGDYDRSKDFYSMSLSYSGKYLAIVTSDGMYVYAVGDPATRIAFLRSIWVVCWGGADEQLYVYASFINGEELDVNTIFEFSTADKLKSKKVIAEVYDYRIGFAYATTTFEYLKACNAFRINGRYLVSPSISITAVAKGDEDSDSRLLSDGARWVRKGNVGKSVEFVDENSRIIGALTLDINDENEETPRNWATFSLVTSTVGNKFAVVRGMYDEATGNDLIVVFIFDSITGKFLGKTQKIPVIETNDAYHDIVFTNDGNVMYVFARQFKVHKYSITE